MPIHKVLLWSGFGVAVRLWQLGIEMRPLFSRQTFWVYPVYAGIGGSFGYWLTGVEARQIEYLNEKREALLEKRRRRAEREGLPERLLMDEEGNEGVPGKTGVGLTPAEAGAAGFGEAKPLQQ